MGGPCIMMGVPSTPSETMQDKTIIVYYGPSGHGKGLVDVMSAFGAKTLLRRAVVAEDIDYHSAADIQNFLSQKFEQDDQKHYFTIETDTTAKLRENKDTFKIKDRQQQHMIAYFPSGEIQCKVNMCSCEKCLVGKFVNCPYQKGIVVTGSFDNESSTDDSDIEFEMEDTAVEEEGYEIRGDEVLNNQ